MKVAFLSYYSGLLNRGAETFVHELALRLTTSTCQVTVYQGGPSHSQSNYLVKPLSSPHKLPNFGPSPDILIPINGRIQAILSRLWASYNKKQLVIVGESGLGFDDRLNLLTFPNTFVGLTSFQCVWAKRANPVTPVVCIPNGIDLNKFSPHSKRLNLHLPPPIVLFVGALTSDKRPETSIKAVAQTSASLLLVGDGPRKQELQELCQRYLPNRHLITSFPYFQMPSVYASVDLFTYPTVPWESFGISLLEAMASGLGIVASNDPIRQEIVGNAGIFVNPTDITSYATALTKALDINWTDLAVKAARKYDWETISKKYNALFSSLVTN